MLALPIVFLLVFLLYDYAPKTALFGYGQGRHAYAIMQAHAIIRGMAGGLALYTFLFYLFFSK